MKVQSEKKKVLKQLKIKLNQLEIDYFILPNSDQFFLEFLPERQKRVKFLTGFDGSNASLLIGKEESYFFTDGRYTLQASKEVDCEEFEIINMTEISLLNKVKELLQNGQKVAIDPKLLSVNFVEILEKICADKGVELYSFKVNPVDKIWEERAGTEYEPSRPKRNNYKIVNHPISYSGKSKEEKIQAVIDELESDAILISNAESICWLFNIRCHGAVEYSPILPCYVLLYKDGKSDFFLDFDGSGEEKLSFFKDNADLSKIVKFKSVPSRKFTSVQIDPRETNHAVFKTFKELNLRITQKVDPVTAKKAIKNETEVKNAIKAHEIDGLAVTRFLHWLDESVKNNVKIDELGAEEKLLEFRKKSKSFIYDSFRSISGYGPNGAIIHYHASKNSNKKFKNGSLYLIDSGGQYRLGTTDITRTVAIGEVSKEMKHNFTIVLKGHINLALKNFDRATSGADLDKIARSFLNEENKDYEHGTGHGVGSFLGVHEGPVSIGKNAKNHFFDEGMILSNEPGYYLEGCYGIRIESLVLVEKQGKDGLSFRSLTLTPIDPNLVEVEILNKEEKKWLKSYHNEVFSKLKSKLSKKENLWMLDIKGFFDNL